MFHHFWMLMLLLLVIGTSFLDTLMISHLQPFITSSICNLNSMLGGSNGTLR